MMTTAVHSVPMTFTFHLFSHLLGWHFIFDHLFKIQLPPALFYKISITIMATVDVLPQRDDDDEERVGVVPSTQTSLAQPLDAQWLLQHTNLSTLHDLSQLVKLELANCSLTSLPDQLPTLLPNLEILFCPKNNFAVLPPVIGQCPNLRMVSFKECHSIRSIPPEALQPQLQWLILTGNLLQEIPETIGRCNQLQKCMLSGNQLRQLPSGMSQLQNLELIRLACNQLSEPPLALLQQCSNLRWAAFASNPFLQQQSTGARPSSAVSLPLLDDPCLDDVHAQVLGQGAGGVTRKVLYQDRPVAVKTYVGNLTSDGSPQDEKAINVAAATLQDPALIALLGETSNGALVMEFLEGYQALAGPPSFATCSRDVYPDNIAELVSPTFAWTIAVDLLRVLTQLHALGICHADFYAHNILIHSQKEAVKLSDFGAAFFYEIDSAHGKAIQRIELRAYAVLVQELFDLIIVPSHQKEGSSSSEHAWKTLLEECDKADMTFSELRSKFGTKAQA
jgi:tRNA A-37 threonylcarbamoyl transferase component Bud32